jgi:hypothetical protein
MQSEIYFDLKNVIEFFYWLFYKIKHMQFSIKITMINCRLEKFIDLVFNGELVEDGHVRIRGLENTSEHITHLVNTLSSNLIPNGLHIELSTRSSSSSAFIKAIVELMKREDFTYEKFSYSVEIQGVPTELLTSYFELGEKFWGSENFISVLGSGNKVIDKITPIIPILPYYKQSFCFNLEDMDIDNKGAQKFDKILANYPVGMNINLKSNQIADFGFTSIINSLRGKTNGITINLENNKISDIGFMYLANAICNYNLPQSCSISLKENPLSIDGISYFIDKINSSSNAIDFNVHLADVNKCKLSIIVNSSLKKHSDRAIMYLGISLLQTDSPFCSLPDELKYVIFNLVMPLNMVSEGYLKSRMQYLGKEVVAKSKFFDFLTIALNKDCQYK